MTNDKFNFFLPINSDELIKASKETGSKRYSNMIIEGVASDDSMDSDDEILEPNGYDLDRFLKYGFINYDHRAKDNPKYFIGEPIKASVKDNKFYVKGKLYPTSETARDLWDTMIMLKASNSDRKVGWSIEGKAIERHPQNSKRITKALITGVAITLNPKNTNSYADIVKGKQNLDFIDYEYLNKSEIQEANGGKQEFLVDIVDNEKGLRYTIDKNLCLKVEKAMNSINAKPMIKESLEGRKKAIINVTDALFKGVISKDIFEKANRNYNISVVWESIKDGGINNNILAKIL